MIHPGKSKNRSNQTIALMPISHTGVVLLVLTLATQSVLNAQTSKLPPGPIPSLSAMPSDLDFNKALNASEAGLVPDSDEDQSDRLGALMAKVADDPKRDTVYVPEGLYRIAKAIRLRPGVNLTGDGMGRTVFYRDDSRSYLVTSGGHGDFNRATVANLSFRNSGRTLLMTDAHHLRFLNVEFEGGIVRFEKSSHVTIERCFFNRNRGKGGYASADCSDMRILHNRFLSVEKGSINLSSHRRSYVAYNHITAEKLIDSGYAGIRLPNTAKDNLVENNYIENHGRGIFILTYSSGNTVRHNTVNRTKGFGIWVQSPNNRIEHNVVIDAGTSAIRISDAHYAKQPKSIASSNQILRNIVTDTHGADVDTRVGLWIGSSDTIVAGNVVDRRFGRAFMNFKEHGDNVRQGNVYR